MRYQDVLQLLALRHFGDDAFHAAQQDEPQLRLCGSRPSQTTIQRQQAPLQSFGDECQLQGGPLSQLRGDVRYQSRVASGIARAHADQQLEHQDLYGARQGGQTLHQWLRVLRSVREQLQLLLLLTLQGQEGCFQVQALAADIA